MSSWRISSGPTEGFWGKILVPWNSPFQTVYSSLRVQLVHGAIRMVSSVSFFEEEAEREPETGIMRNQSLWFDLAVKNSEVCKQSKTHVLNVTGLFPMINPWLVLSIIRIVGLESEFHDFWVKDVVYLKSTEVSSHIPINSRNRHTVFPTCQNTTEENHNKVLRHLASSNVSCVFWWNFVTVGLQFLRRFNQLTKTLGPGVASLLTDDIMKFMCCIKCYMNISYFGCC